MPAGGVAGEMAYQIRLSTLQHLHLLSLTQMVDACLGGTIKTPEKALVFAMG